MSPRKLVGLDEAHFMEGWRSGRSFLVRLARDSRKWNLAALVASQNPRDILGLDVQNLVSTVFVGRIAEDAEIASEALRLLRVPADDGYEADPGLAVPASTRRRRPGSGFREFVMRDVDGRVQKVRVDVSYVDGLLDHLDTTPAAAAPQPSILPARPPTWRPEMARARARVVSLVLAIVVAAVATIAWPAARRRPRRPRRSPRRRATLCSHRGVAGRLPGAASTGCPTSAAARAQCLKAPTPSTPDSGPGRLVRRAARQLGQDSGCRRASTATTATPATATRPTTSTAAAPRR